MRNRLIQLLSDNRRPYVPMSQRIVAPAGAGGGNEATVYLYDAIVGDRLTAEWWGGVCPQDFVPAFAAIQADVIHLRVNSPGGDVFAAEAICQALREHSATVVAHIEGLAASAATAVCCAADEVVITPASKYMIHKTWTYALGNADDMRATAQLLDVCDSSLIEEYVRRTGNEAAQVEAWCAAETWFTAAQAIEHKFADRLAEAAGGTAASASASAAARWNLRAYTRTPAELMQTSAPAPAPADPPAATPDHRARQQQRLRMASLAHIV